jgi:S1-C subfamily serine protease
VPAAQKEHVRRPQNSTDGMESKGFDGHPSDTFMEEVAERAATLEGARQGFPTLWAHLQECDECLQAFQELLGVAYEQGHRDQQAREDGSARTVVTTAVVAVLAVVMLATGLFVFYDPNGDMAVNRVYNAVAPAVANIEIVSSGTKGSGVVYDRDGHVLTNYHVIQSAQNDADISVTLPRLGDLPSTLVGYDVPTDLAVLHVEADPSQLAVAQFGNSDAVQVGDLAIAIGNPFGLSQTLTVGHISAVGRRLMTNDPYAPDVEGVIQTDAAINPGNSGGPLLNGQGQVIGINTRIESPSRGSVGLGFAIPSTTASQVAEEIIQRGYVRRPFLGVAGQPLTAQQAAQLGLPVSYGLTVKEVQPDSPADRLGLHPAATDSQAGSADSSQGGDIILAVDGQQVRSLEDLNREISRRQIGEQVELRIWRNGQEVSLSTTLVERPRMGPKIQ